MLPLCVDLDGTLIEGDLLVHNLISLLKYQPLYILILPFWLISGRAGFKEKVARVKSLEIEKLKFNDRLKDFLFSEKERGRKIVLVTGSNIHIARAIAEHMKIFSEVLASDANLNLTGRRKAEVLVRHFGQHNFDYIGNSYTDIPVWESCRKLYIVSDKPKLIKRVKEIGQIDFNFRWK